MIPLQIPPLFKIPCLLLCSICTYITFNPPNPPASDDEMTKFDNAKVEASGWRTTILKNTTHCVTGIFYVVEISLILASEVNPHSNLEDIASSEEVSYAPYLIRLTPTFVLGTAMIVAAASTRLACYRALDHMFTFQLSIKKNHRLVTTGPYAYVRHPSYTAIIAHEFGCLLIQLEPGSWWYESGRWSLLFGLAFAAGWIVLKWKIVTFFIYRVEKEDRVLQQEFGKERDEWQKRTPYRLIPLVW